ncbi:unnamed protein product [Notodromas monacha]|uniref:Uncharacterized protein n=1 Tax=Notodromas monacha TaxID=399045 RepID=A0A7R9BPH1_9CRUS|nr:unnamed protein product [Notodromas monacha]CAG0919259.1 unnamed protein product [Notodromas monacha]
MAKFNVAVFVVLSSRRRAWLPQFSTGPCPVRVSTGVAPLRFCSWKPTLSCDSSTRGLKDRFTCTAVFVALEKSIARDVHFVLWQPIALIDDCVMSKSTQQHNAHLSLRHLLHFEFHGHKPTRSRKLSLPPIFFSNSARRHSAFPSSERRGSLGSSDDRHTAILFRDARGAPGDTLLSRRPNAEAPWDRRMTATLQSCFVMPAA